MKKALLFFLIEKWNSPKHRKQIILLAIVVGLFGVVALSLGVYVSLWVAGQLISVLQSDGAQSLAVNPVASFQNAQQTLVSASCWDQVSKMMSWSQWVDVPLSKNIEVLKASCGKLENPV